MPLSIPCEANGNYLAGLCQWDPQMNPLQQRVSLFKSGRGAHVRLLFVIRSQQGALLFVIKNQQDATVAIWRLLGTFLDI